MAEFNWVKARFGCSVKSVLKKLEVGARADVSAIAEIARQLGKQETYEVAPFADRFSVIRKKFGAVMSVDFTIDQAEIVASVGDESECPIVRGIPTVNRDGACVLLVDDVEWELWHFRRAALDSLFFREYGGVR